MEYITLAASTISRTVVAAYPFEANSLVAPARRRSLTSPPVSVFFRSFFAIPPFHAFRFVIYLPVSIRAGAIVSTKYLPTGNRKLRCPRGDPVGRKDLPGQGTGSAGDPQRS